jgi:hypothetical protein
MAGWNLPKSGNAELNNVTIREWYTPRWQFKGTVEATTFVGDIANVGIGSDVRFLAAGLRHENYVYGFLIISTQ